MTQCEKLLGYMKLYGSVTGLESVVQLGVLNYKGRINDLRKRGFSIKTTMETTTNAQGEKKTFARYSLEG